MEHDEYYSKINDFLLEALVLMKEFRQVTHTPYISKSQLAVIDAIENLKKEKGQ